MSQLISVPPDGAAPTWDRESDENDATQEEFRDAFGPIGRSEADPRFPTPPEPDAVWREIRPEPSSSADSPSPSLTDLIAGVAQLELEAAMQGIRDARGLRTQPSLDPDLWGPDPAPRQVIRASTRSTVALGQARRRLAEDSLPVPEFAERAGLEPDHVRTLAEGGRLLTLKVNGETLVPAWQLTDDGIVPGLDAVLPEIAGGPLTVTAWMTSTSTLLGGRTPRSALIAGDVQAVVDAARARER